MAADCKQPDGTYATSYIDLDSHLGNDHGRFKRGGHEFSKTSRNIKLVGTTLQAELGANDGTSPLSTVDVSRIVRCERGRLIPFTVQDPFDTPAPVYDLGFPAHQSIPGCRFVHLLGNHVLVARCYVRGGRTQEAAFKLDSIFGIHDGRLRPFGNNFHSAQEIGEKGIRLDGSVLSVDMVIEKNSETIRKTETVDLKDFVTNNNGKLVLREWGPCSGCESLFRAGRIYSPMSDKRRTKLESFNVANVNSSCALCKVVEGVIKATVPFIRTCEVVVECSTDFQYLINSVELDVTVNNLSRRYAIYVDNSKRGITRTNE